MKRSPDYLIVTNNPLVVECMSDCYEVQYEKDRSYRDILIQVRDMIYQGHTLYTHPIAGSVKPNETPYKSIVVSKVPHALCLEHAELVSNSILTYDKFTPRSRDLTEPVRKDFQLIDYTLLAGALDFDATAGLSKYSSLSK